MNEKDNKRHRHDWLSIFKKMKLHILHHLQNQVTAILEIKTFLI